MEKERAAETALDGGVAEKSDDNRGLSIPPQCREAGDEAEFVQKAKSHNLLLVPGSNFGTPGNVRLAYCVSPDMIRRSLTAFAALAEECGLKK